MTGRQIIKIMKSNGWVLDRISGSHHVMVKDGCRSIPVPIHGNKDLGIWAQKILIEAGIRS
ncbi:MAG: addiction module toxin, HicA family [Spirochaetae bacterium HGW-Spirochaetae-7]|nr:MAG: addiction module toxin, HicA family [Spirochaetae bacterium HGW-Spirochaetae-7]